MRDDEREGVELGPAGLQVGGHLAGVAARDLEVGRRVVGREAGGRVGGGEIEPDDRAGGQCHCGGRDQGSAERLCH